MLFNLIDWSTENSQPNFGSAEFNFDWMKLQNGDLAHSRTDFTW